MSKISDSHRSLLTASAVDLKVAEELEVYSVSSVEELPADFTHYGTKAVPGLVFPWPSSSNGTRLQPVRTSRGTPMPSTSSRPGRPARCASILGWGPGSPTRDPARGRRGDQAVPRGRLRPDLDVLRGRRDGRLLRMEPRTTSRSRTSLGSRGRAGRSTSSSTPTLGTTSTSGMPLTASERSSSFGERPRSATSGSRDARRTASTTS